MWKHFFYILKQNTRLTTLRNLYKHVYKMDKAYLRCLADAKHFQISFHYKNPDLRVDRQFNFQRQLSENVNTFLSRVGANLEKVISKKSKKKKVNSDKGNDVKGDNKQVLNDGQNIDAGKSTNDNKNANDNKNVNKSIVEGKDDNDSVVLTLLNNNVAVNGDAICSDVFQDGNSVVLQVNGIEYNVIINSPWIETLTLPNSILAGFPVYPLKYEVVNANKDLSDFIWFKSTDKKHWSQISKGFIYQAQNNDIDNYLKLVAVPRNEKAEGAAIECESKVKVEANPGECPFERRHKFCEERCTGRKFRVVSYNILADLYCDSDYTRAVLFPYCPPYALAIDYRKQLILKELIGYNADLICLQEVDKKVYQYDLNPVLSNLNYESVFSLKGGLVAEGVACFYHTSKFRYATAFFSFFLKAALSIKSIIFF